MQHPTEVLYLKAIDLLRTSIMEQAKPEVVRGRAAELAKMRPGAAVDVFWELEPYSKHYHYELLVRVPGIPTMMVSAGLDRGIPWVYRGAFRWNETVLLRVNNQRILMHDAITRCDSLWGQSSIAERLVNGALVADYAERCDAKQVDIGADEIQQAADAIRARHGLLTESATRDWMERRGITTEGLAQMASELALGLKVREHVVAGADEEAYFAEHKADFARVALLEVRARTQEVAAQLYREACEVPDGGLIGAVHRRAMASLAGSGEQSMVQPAYRTMWRSSLDAEVERIFAARPPQVLAPFIAGDDWTVVQVLDQQPPVWDAPTKLEVQDRIFKNWLAEQRRQARIEWSWERATAARA